ncbi:hypothetical protein ETB97_009465 [Aspergillus alliaceus]|uniref:Uncharacterized protein n=1 Tax=Petromyces alliaceus TaxID=209559 RepID=A0A8H5ZUB7_PETAA|nr:hypothetical protein ETB97_009465 [Aspergillus burnettii]
MFTVNLTAAEFTKALRAEKQVFLNPRNARPLYFILNAVISLLLSLGIIMNVTATDKHKVDAGDTFLKISLVTQLIFWLFAFNDNAVMSFWLGRNPSKESLEVMPKWKRWNQSFRMAISIIALGHNVMQLTQISMSDGFMSTTD